MIYVTHDQVEAMTLADKIVVLRAGRIEQVGSPLDLYRDPDNRFVAGFIGSPAMNFLKGTVGQGGEVSVKGLAATLRPQAALPAPGTEVIVGIRPQHMTLDPGGATHAVDLAEQLGGVSYVYLVADTGERIIVEAREGVAVPQSGRSGLVVDAGKVLVFDAKTEARIR
jgi:lactose/L-arabinose transport system ATP-binding protein